MSEASTPPTSNILRVSSQTRGTAAIVNAEGDLDMATASMLSKALADAEAAGPERVVLDMSGVAFLASAGMTVLAEHHQRCQELGVPFVVVNPNRSTLRTLELTGMSDLLTIVPGIDHALA